MKNKFFAFTITVLSIAHHLHAQTPFNTMDSVNINKINALVLVHGDMFWNPITQVAACEFPAGSKKHINFASALWMSGYDGGGQLHVAAQTYRQDGNDYWPGPLNSAGPITHATSQDWAKIWKINRTEIQYFQSLSTHTTSNTPAPILTWPGKGNTYARGHAGASLTVTTDMAPFADLNANGVYEPLLGEYPDVKGDQALWWVFNDNGPTHSQSMGQPLSVEIRTMAYGYNRGTLIDNVVYFDYLIVNRSSNNYTNYRLGLWDDIDLGYYMDDYIGFDSSHRMGITYNATNDDGGLAGHPPNSYGTHVPVVGTTMIVLPGDAGTSYLPAGSYITFNNDNSIYGNPSKDTQFNNYLRAENRVKTHFTYTFSGATVPCAPQGTGPATNYLYTGDPSNVAEWSECGCNNTPGDRRFVISSNDFTLSAGSSAHIVMAIVTTDTNEHGCPTASFNNIKIVADTAWKNYFSPPSPLPPSSVNDLAVSHALHIYPNPAKDKLFIESMVATAGEASITFYNALGQIINVSLNKSNKGHEADISKLPAGLYNVLYRCGDTYTTAKFIKE